MVLPPPNITGEMHIGHFFQYFIIDLIIKFKILQNYKIIYIFGFDHAGISAFLKFKKKKKINKQKKILEKKYFFQLKYINFYIINKKIEFTINKNYEKIIIKYFLSFYKKKIVFIKKKHINYIKNEIISDSEINKKIFFKKMYFLKYKKKNFYIISKTSNLKSIIFNTFLYYNYFKKKFFHLFTPFKIKILFLINNINFNKQIVKLSPNINNYDYLICFKNKQKIIINNKKYIFYKLRKNYFIRTNKKIFFYIISKKKIFYFLKKNNYIISVKNYISYKNFATKKIIKNKLFDQWYLKIKKLINLKKILINFKIIPNKYKKIFFTWIKNINNWCISRKINWGTKIPIFFDNEFNIYIYKYDRIEKFFHLKEVFDTWYNSSFWIFFNFVKNNKILDIILSGFDIIFYWIIKMIIINILIKKNLLIKKIIIHGLIKDKFGKKISKTTNNFINFNQIKKNINKIRSFLIKNIYEDNKIINFLIKKKFFIIKNQNFLNIISDIYYFYKFKKKILFFFKKKIFFEKKKTFLNKNICSKKIFILITKLLYPIKNFIKTIEWNFILNIFLNKIIFIYIFLIKIKNRNYLIKKKNYFEIFFKIKTVFYVKHKN
ncbi:class I tRNA ligase family protein [Candidatus Carsonella ruddii]|uniref:class I tRNA ligase family protein n=1 Tax=Carsonella ruddii TaxID=114186 RepID=UPI00247A1D4D|nr:class I tRNA ligase family protein [Candidatus Carsonella ruddii]